MWIPITVLIPSSILPFPKSVHHLRAEGRGSTPRSALLSSFQSRSCQNWRALPNNVGSGWWELFIKWLKRKTTSHLFIIFFIIAIILKDYCLSFSHPLEMIFQHLTGRRCKKKKKSDILARMFSSVQSLSHVRLCNPMNRSTPGLPVYHQLLEFTQTRVRWVCDAIQPSHPLSSPSPPAPSPSQNQSLFQWVNSSHEVAKVLEFQL